MAVILNSTKNVDLGIGTKINTEVTSDILKLSLTGKTAQITGTANAVPTMTSDTAPSGQVIYGYGGYDGNRAPWRAFDKNTSTQYLSYTGNLPNYLGYVFASAKKIVGYGIRSGTYQAPTTWTFQGSNNGSTWTTLDTKTNETVSSSSITKYSFPNSSFYTYYRLYVTAVKDATGGGGFYFSMNEMEMYESVDVPTYYSTGSFETPPYDLGAHLRNIEKIALTKTIPQGTGMLVYTSTSGNNQDFSDWSLINSDGTINSPIARYVKLKIVLNGEKTPVVNSNEFVSITTPTTSNVIINYKEIDKKYSGLMFMDTSQQYYSTSIGELLRYLDFNTLIAGQNSLDVKVILTNTYPFNVKNLKITSIHHINGLQVELSKSNNPFISEETLMYNQELKFDETLDFYVRLAISESAVGGGEFDIKVDADPI